MGEGHLPYCGQNCAPCHQIWEFLRHAIAHFAMLCTLCTAVHLHACIMAKNQLSTTFVNFRPNMYLHKCNCTHAHQRTDTNKFPICQLWSDNWEVGQRDFKIVTSSPKSANWREAVWLNTEYKAFNDAIHTSYFPPPIHTRTQQRGKLLTVFPPNFARTGRFQKLFKAQL